MTQVRFRLCHFVILRLDDYEVCLVQESALVRKNNIDAYRLMRVVEDVDPYNEDDNIKASFVKGRWLRSRRRDFPLFILHLRRVVEDRGPQAALVGEDIILPLLFGAYCSRRVAQQ